MSHIVGTENSVRSKLDQFLASPYYIITAALLSLVAHLLSAELLAYTLLIAVAVYIGLWGKDLLPLTPLFLFCYILPSAANNPGRNEASVFSGWRGIWLLCLGLLLVGSTVCFVIRQRKGFFSARCRLLPGMLVLCGAYLLSGIGSAAYPAFLGQNLLYCALQCLCLVLPYWLLSHGVRWDSARKDYLGWISVCGGVLILLQLLWCYATGGVIADGAIVRTQIFTGWGMYNNMGAMLGMMLPFVFSLGLSHKKEWLGLLGGILLLGSIFLTCSRASILAGCLIFCVCLSLMVYYSQNRKLLVRVLLVLLGLGLLAAVLLHEKLLQLFSDIIRRGLDPTTRDEIYAEGIKLFREAPVFGNSFFSPGYVPWDFSTVDAFSAIIPPRWCNTVVQLLVSAGVVGLLAYLLHRVDTVLLFVKRRSGKNSFILCSIAVLLITSLLDCHFFNLGPVLFYSAALAFAEQQA